MLSYYWYFYKSRKDNSNSHFPTSFVIEKCLLCHQAAHIRKRTWQKHFKWQKTVVKETSPSKPSPNTLPRRAGKVIFLLTCVKSPSNNYCVILSGLPEKIKTISVWIKSSHGWWKKVCGLHSHETIQKANIHQNSGKGFVKFHNET